MIVPIFGSANVRPVTKCMNPDDECENKTDSVSPYVFMHEGITFVLCNLCGPQFQLRVILDWHIASRKAQLAKYIANLTKATPMATVLSRN
jgi:hypothetical protein